MQAHDDLDLLVSAAQDGAEVAMRHWRSAPAAWEKEGNQGPVSEADLEVDAVLSQRLRAARPDYGWLSEETEDDPRRLEADRVFIVDPIDGTRSYLEGRTPWALSLAISHLGRVETAVVLMPAKDRIYTAALGKGALLNGRPIRASGRVRLEDALVLAPRAALTVETWGRNRVPPVERHFRPSLAYRLCLVAEGRFDAMLALADCWEWDIAAGALIAEEATARVTDRSGLPLVFNSATARTPGAIAATPALHPGLVAPRQAS